jgi:hypothetical protein
LSEPARELVPIDGEVVEPTPSPSMTLFGTDDPDAFIQHATKSAEALAKVVADRKLTTTISRRQHVRVEGWTLLGSMLGVFPVCVWTRKLEDGWEARVEARTRSGEIVGAAEAECLYSENTWKNRDDYALRSMAQTRATSKALRQPLGFVMTLAGFDATPAEEMPRDSNSRGGTPKPRQLTRDEAIAELRERQKKLGRIDRAWTQESIFSHVSAQLGEPVKKWDELPDAAVQQLLTAARHASSGIEEAVGIDPPDSEFVAPTGARGQAGA